jgi:MoxR-like ATPase
VHDAIRRRCLYHWVDYPDAAREQAILRIKAPGIAEMLSAEITAFVQRLRGAELFKPPGVAETIDWAAALTALDQHELTAGAVEDTIGVLLKYQDDIAGLRVPGIGVLVTEAKQAARAA